MEYAVGDEVFRAVGEVILAIQDDLSADWSLARIAAKTGYQEHHVAHAFSAVVGVPPMAYVRLLRLERAAHLLAYDADATLMTVAAEAGYGSGNAFRRAFARAFGRSVTTVRDEVRRRTAAPTSARDVAEPFPPQLRGAPAVVRTEAMTGVSLQATAYEPLAIRTAMGQFARLVPPPSERWGWGSTTPAHGWATQSGRREFRWIRIDAPAKGADVVASPPPPLHRWRLAPAWFAQFDYRGLESEFAGVYGWIFRRWLPSSGMRFGFSPIVTLIDAAAWGPPSGAPLDARLLVPVESLAVDSARAAAI